MDRIYLDKLICATVKGLIDRGVMPKVEAQSIATIVEEAVTQHDRYRAAEGKGPEWR